MSDLITDFESRWAYVHSMARVFAETVPEEQWLFSPHPRFAPFAKQLRHVVCVRGAYRSGITDGKPDFSRKHDHYSGPLDRSALLAALDQQHAALGEALRAAATENPAKTVDFAGRPFSLLEYTYVIMQHEGVHFGEWSLYASLAGFETPLDWRLQWGL